MNNYKDSDGTFDYDKITLHLVGILVSVVFIALVIFNVISYKG
jgi:hypothetical protein